jgi:hypothetical protein
VNVGIDAEILGCVPHRLADWRAGEDGNVVVERPKPATTGLRGLVDRLEWFMTYPRIRLDAVGSTVWQRMDGAATLSEIATATGGAFPDRTEEMPERVALFATALQHQGLIELRVSGGGRESTAFGDPERTV